MIIARSPLRISLGGGGTDLPSYYREHGGFVLSASINKYVYITIHKTFVRDLIVKYSELERVNSRDDLKHPIVREALVMAGLDGSYLEITSMADIPAGTGLGSSGSFTTALLRALYFFQKKLVPPAELAKRAAEIEIDRLGEPIGKQDQYISAFGGITQFCFNRDDSVNVRPLICSQNTLHNLEENLLLFFTGYSRRASSILREQDSKSRADDSSMTDHLDYVKDLGLRSLRAIQNDDLHGFGEIMHKHWEHKKTRSQRMTTTEIDEWYDLGLKSGAIGGKLVGAGGGGFLMFYTEDRMRLRDALSKIGLQEVRFSFDFEGTKIIAS